MDRKAWKKLNKTQQSDTAQFNPLSAELNPIYHFLALLGAHNILCVSGVRVNERHSTLLHVSVPKKSSLENS